jgi:predicted TPR repeat methyltransferase
VARKIVGVDLSSRMIGQARQRKVYDELFVDEIVAFLSVRFGQFDALVSADVLIYVGDLRAFFAAAGQALKAGGLLAFSVEKHEGEGFALGVTRRFSHSIGYVRAALAGAGFRELHAGEEELRIEHGVGVPSWVVVAQREL